MNPQFNSFPDLPVLPDPGRRKLLAGVSGLLLTAAVTGCAAPPPEAEPFDPSSLVYPPPPEIPRFYYDRTIWGSNAVTEDTSSDRFRRFATGESIRGQGMSKPYSVVVRDGRLFVSDTVSRRVHVFDQLPDRAARHRAAADHALAGSYRRDDRAVGFGAGRCLEGA